MNNYDKQPLKIHKTFSIKSSVKRSVNLEFNFRTDISN